MTRANIEPVVMRVVAAVHPTFDVATQRALARDLRRCYTDAARRWTVYADARPALETARHRGVRNAVISNHVPELREMLVGWRLADYFDLVINSAEVGYEKPHPHIYAVALSPAGVSTAWMIGDNPRADVHGAEAAGIKGVLVRRPGDLGDRGGAPRVAASLIDAVEQVFA